MPVCLKYIHQYITELGQCNGLLALCLPVVQSANDLVPTQLDNIFMNFFSVGKLTINAKVLISGQPECLLQSGLNSNKEVFP